MSYKVIGIINSHAYEIAMFTNLNDAYYFCEYLISIGYDVAEVESSKTGLTVGRYAKAR